MFMRFGTANKLALLGLLGVAASLITSSMVASGSNKQDKKRKNTAQAVQSAPPSNIEIGDVTPTGRTPSSSPPRVPHPIAREGFTSIRLDSVQPEGGGFYHVAGKANLSYGEKGASFAWAIRVRDDSKKVFVAEKIYDDQIFKMSPDKKIYSCTFDDIIPIDIETGRYRVELVLYRVPQEGLEALDNPDIKRASVLAKDSKYVSFE